MDLEELRECCITNHRDMWHWLAGNPDKEKADWPGWKYHNNDVFDKEGSNYCFLCGYASAIPNKDINECLNCPLGWGITDECVDDDSYYKKYRDSVTITDKTKYAEIIANLPEKDDTKDRLIIEETMWRC